MKLTNLTHQVLSQMIDSEPISSNIAKPLFNKINKVGVVSVLALTAFFSTGMAQAGALGGTIGVSALLGLLTNGSRPPDVPNDCNVQGTNGYIVGGAGAAGAYALNQLGGGSGKTALTIAGGFLGATAGQSAENNRIRNDCLRQQGANYQNNYQQPQQYHQPQQARYTQPPQYNPPQIVPRHSRNNAPTAMPQEMILYATEGYQGNVAYITASTSPGVASLSGHRSGHDPQSNPNVQEDMSVAMQNMVNSYQVLSQQANNYNSIAQGRRISGEQDLSGGARDFVAQENEKLQAAFSEYSYNRAIFTHTADNVAMNGYNISGYSNALNYMTPPPSLKVAYSGRNINRYSTLTIQK